MERNMSVDEICYYVILSSQLATLPIPELIYLPIKLTFTMFQQAIKFDCLVLEIFQSF